jgi:hypothetical protein
MRYRQLLVWRGLTPTDWAIRVWTRGWGDLAAIAMNHLANVVKVFGSVILAGKSRPAVLRAGRFAGRYRPYPMGKLRPRSFSGRTSKPGYVGWTGLPDRRPWKMFRPGSGCPAAKLTWNVRLLDAHGVSRYPFGQQGLLDLKCARRSSVQEKPMIEIQSNVPLVLELYWEGGLETITVL